MTIQDAAKEIRKELRAIYEEGESAAISNLVIEHLAGALSSNRSLQKEQSLIPEQEEQFNVILSRLLKHEPVQYVLEEAWFAGVKFYVDKNVLIPRPETEELVEWVIANCKFPLDKLSILDIGTGSGCIPITLKRRLRKASISSCDISEAALAVAKRNALTIGVDINFLHLNFLERSQRESLPRFDIIISNPPYVPVKDKESMQANVLNYEPHTALFVPDNDALVFYKAIAEFGSAHLEPGGSIYTELHEDLAQSAQQLFTANGYNTEIKKDMQDKERMLKAIH